LDDHAALSCRLLDISCGCFGNGGGDGLALPIVRAALLLLLLGWLYGRALVANTQAVPKPSETI